MNLTGRELPTQSEACGQVIGWERGRPARNEREARKWIGANEFRVTARLRRVADETPAVPAIT
ncbi:MAG: hypothetical protein ABJA18_07855 [bacterium]